MVLDAIVHKDQKFIFTEPIQIELRDSVLLSCTLISESECLVLTNKKVILVSLIDQTKRDISYPQGIKFTDYRLNLMVNGIP